MLILKGNWDYFSISGDSPFSRHTKHPAAIFEQMCQYKNRLQVLVDCREGIIFEVDIILLLDHGYSRQLFQLPLHCAQDRGVLVETKLKKGF